MSATARQADPCLCHHGCVREDMLHHRPLQSSFVSKRLPCQALCPSRHGNFAFNDAEALLGAQKIMPLGEVKHRFALPENTEEREDII